ASGFPQVIPMGVSVKQQTPTDSVYSKPVSFVTVKCSTSPSPTPSPTPPSNSGNIASNAVVSVSSTSSPVGSTTFIGDNAKDNSLATEWASQEEFTPWIQLTWSNAHTISRIKLFDRPNTIDKIGAGYLSFSDGSTVRVGQLPDNGDAYEATFPPKNGITWVRFQITAGAGQNVGLSEFQVFSN
ncbi:MAG TPA: hypothetical protein VEW42_00545, partial [Candidatus Eisenbacteria bacterium]|nr:hypothetical protein [Candidatus Eisenbacteria bacterium]